MIKLTRLITGLITIVCVALTVIAALNEEKILASPFLMTALLFNILQMLNHFVRLILRKKIPSIFPKKSICLYFSFFFG